jgi:glyoxylase-like metal-dependent hydrolase (beta-lactamase superfamily II)
MVLSTHVAPPFYKNGFLLGCEETREAVVLDPGDEVEDVVLAVAASQLKVKHILLTHAHLDHVTGVRRARDAFGAPVYMHQADLPLYERVVQQGVMFGLRVEPQPPVDRYFTPGEVIRFGRYAVRVHHTPGHSPGGVCLQVGHERGEGKDLFVGDTLFAGSIGRTDLPGADHTTLLASIRDVLFAFPDDATVYPGHGEPTTIGRERRTNPFLR